MSKNSLVKNFAFLTVAEGLSKVATFIAFAYLARVFGPAGFGYVEWAAAILMCASLIVDQGFNAYGAREIARDPERTPELLSEVVTARFLLAAIGYAGIAAFAYFFVRERAVFDLLLIYGLSLWALPLLLQWVFQGHDRMDIVALTQIVRQTSFAVVVLTFVRGQNDISVVGFAEVAAVAIAAFFTVTMYKRYISKTLGLRPVLSATLFREGVPIGMSQMFWVVRMFGATLVLGFVATAQDTGYFAGALRLFIALHTFIWLYYFNLFPSMSRAWAEGEGVFKALIGRSMRLVTVSSAFVAAVWILLAPKVVTVVYGPDFSAAAAALQWMACSWAAAAISGHFRFGLVAAGYQNREMGSSAVGATAAVVLIPIGYTNAGPGGAAAALFAAEMIVLLLTWFLSRRSFRGADRSAGTTESLIGELQEAVR